MSVTTEQYERVGTNRYRVTGVGKTRVEPLMFLDDALLEQIKQDRSIPQLIDAASMPGVVFVCGMPDMHQGYGVPVGCVMAMDAEVGLVSAGAVGMDINCGVRLLSTNIPAEALSREEQKQLGREVLRRVPVGIGTSSQHKKELESIQEDILLHGVKALVEQGFAREEDLDLIQDRGNYPNARLEPIPSRARERLGQLSTLGGGNHFLELVRVGRVTDPERAEVFGLREDYLGFLIHTGSRGFGHQICVDYSERMNDCADEFGLEFPSKELAAAPIDSKLGQDYLGAMACAANIAYANRQMITYDVRKAFEAFFSNRTEDPDVSIVYDITHNLARFEEIEGSEVLVHRKGAIRSLPAGHPGNPPVYADTGHPLMVPGSMGFGSWVLVAGENVPESYFSINHGAGRRMSRTRAKEQISEEMMLEQLGDAQLLGASRAKIRDEAPGAYKDLENVVDVLTEIDVAQRVAHLEPLVVIKGD